MPRFQLTLAPIALASIVVLGSSGCAGTTVFPEPVAGGDGGPSSVGSFVDLGSLPAADAGITTGTDAGGGAADLASADDAAVADPGCKDGWCLVKAGVFSMGSPAGEACRKEDEQQHSVQLTTDFRIQTYEVRRGEYRTLMGAAEMPAINWAASFAEGICTKKCFFEEDRAACAAACPMTRVTWHQAAAYCNGLTGKQLQGQCQICVGSGASAVCKPADPALCQCYVCTGSGASLRCETAPQYQGDKIYNCPGVRLPTEAEWEMAYRAGTQTAYYNGDNSECADADDANATAIGWYKRNAYVNVGPNVFLPLHPGGEQIANPWGIHDMAGNVGEWTHSFYASYPAAQQVIDPNPMSTTLAPLTKRVVRGGHYNSFASDLRAAARSGVLPTIAQPHHGFRCVQTVFK